jgi:ectoine hydroxylase-related dioxygenase (phytanoyl-CoA dioxygenase family)
MTTILTPDQHQFFTDNGYILLSGLVPEPIVEAAATRLSELYEGNTFFGVKDPAFAACYSESLCRAARELSGNDGDFSTYYPVAQTSDREWQSPPPHIDHALEQNNFNVFPRPMRLASMFYLSDIRPHGGGTVVWPGSHKKVEALAQTDVVKYERMFHLNNDLPLLDLGEPIELTPKKGDVLFYHYLCAHAGSTNNNPEPRLAINHKW